MSRNKGPMMKRMLFPVAALVALSGCLSFGEDPPPFLMTLTADTQVEAGATRSAGIGQAITIEKPDVPQALVTNRLPVTTSDTSIAYLQNALWVDTPNELLRALLAEVTAARTGRVVLDPSQYHADPGTVVTGQLQRFGLDARTRQVVIVYDAQLNGEGGVRTRRFEQREPVAAEDAGSVANALNRAANRLAIEFSDWIA